VTARPARAAWNATEHPITPPPTKMTSIGKLNVEG
jgi:hypothetical protein